MRSRFLTFALTAVLSICLGTLFAAEKAKTRVLIVTGGHDFERQQFFQMFKDNPEITFEEVQHPNAHAKFRPNEAKNYDVFLFYDMYQPISEETKGDLLSLLNTGKGLVVMHHALASYQAWPEYEKIAGGRYYLKSEIVNGQQRRGSTYKHDIDLKVKVADPNHPITRGIADFEIRDEGYNYFGVGEQVHPLLTTVHPESGPRIAWAQEYGKSRVATLQGGHDHFAYENSSFRKLVQQAIRWAARKD